MKRAIVGLALLGAVAGSGCHRKPVALPEILGQINDEYLTTDEFMHHLKMRGGMDLEGEARGALKRFVLAEIVTRKLLLQEARRQGMKLSREDVRGAFAEEGSRAWEKPDRERAWNVEDDLVEQRLIERLLRDVLPTQEEPGGRESRAYLEAHPELLARPIQVKIRQIVVHSATMATTIERHRKDGDEFADLARRAGEKVRASAWYGPEDLPAPVWDAAEEARTGRILGPIPTEYGWNLVQVTGKRAADSVHRSDALAMARREIKAGRRREATEKYVARLRARAMIRLDMAAVAAL